MRAFVINCVAWFATALAWLLPKRSSVLLSGGVAREGNALEVARRLTERYGGRIFWVDAPPADYLAAAGLERADRIEPLGGQLKLRTLFRYATSEAIFFTHGILGIPSPGRRQTVVNLWHGEPLKSGDLFPNRRLLGRAATYLVGSSEVLTAHKAELSKMVMGDTILTGNPRTDEFVDPLADDELRRLGVPEDRPFVLWMPTFRQAALAESPVVWSNTTDVEADNALADNFAKVVAALQDRGICVIVKPHPLDAVSRSVVDAVVLEDADLDAAGIPLYRLVGTAAGLITDYSSVWVDFLQADRPIGFYIPDIDAFRAARDLHPASAIDALPGHLLDTTEATARFASEVLGHTASTAQLRETVRERLGLHRTLTSADDLLDVLSNVGAFEVSGTLPPRRSQLTYD